MMLGCTAQVEPFRSDQVPVPPLVAQRVAAAVQREAARLVRLETEQRFRAEAAEAELTREVALFERELEKRG